MRGSFRFTNADVLIEEEFQRISFCFENGLITDLAEIEVATEATQSSLEKMLYGNALVITAIHGSGSTQALGATYEALYVGVGGDVVVTMVGTGNFTFKNVASGQLLPIRITHVVNTNTTATNMIALKA